MLRKNLISPDDGLVAKKGEWRSSFSLGERNLIGLNLELYQALKYLNKVTILVFHLKHSLTGVGEPHWYPVLPLERDLLLLHHQPSLLRQEGEPSNVAGAIGPPCRDSSNCNALLQHQTRKPDVFQLPATVQQGPLHIWGRVWVSEEWTEKTSHGKDGGISLPMALKGKE